MIGPHNLGIHFARRSEKNDERTKSASLTSHYFVHASDFTERDNRRCSVPDTLYGLSRLFHGMPGVLLPRLELSAG